MAHLCLVQITVECFHRYPIRRRTRTIHVHRQHFYLQEKFKGRQIDSSFFWKKKISENRKLPGKSNLFLNQTRRATFDRRVPLPCVLVHLSPDDFVF